jgi:Protein of unknown function with PCYCGC motif
MVIVLAVPVMIMLWDSRWHDRPAWPPTVPWDPSWPSLPVVSTSGALSSELAEKIYALAATNAETLHYIPCFCGCRSQGHQSNLHCYVRRQAADGRVIEWDSHGRMCPMGHDITGDAMLWHEQGTPLTEIRADIEREYSSRGPATPTPPVPNQ